MPGKFLTTLVIGTADRDLDTGRWVVKAQLKFRSDVAGTIIRVPRGFNTDLASVPRLPFVYVLTGSMADAAAVVHDYLYSTCMYERKVCDDIFLEAMEATGVSCIRRRTIYYGVRIGGWWVYNEYLTRNNKQVK